MSGNSIVRKDFSPSARRPAEDFFALFSAVRSSAFALSFSGHSGFVPQPPRPLHWRRRKTPIVNEKPAATLPAPAGPDRYNHAKFFPMKKVFSRGARDREKLLAFNRINDTMTLTDFVFGNFLYCLVSAFIILSIGHKKNKNKKYKKRSVSFVYFCLPELTWVYILFAAAFRSCVIALCHFQDSYGRGSTGETLKDKKKTGTTGLSLAFCPDRNTLPVPRCGIPLLSHTHVLQVNAEYPLGIRPLAVLFAPYRIRAVQFP